MTFQRSLFAPLAVVKKHCSRLSNSTLVKLSRSFSSPSDDAVTSACSDTLPTGLAMGGLLNASLRFSRTNATTTSAGKAFCRMSTSIAEKLSVGTFKAFRQRIWSCAVSYSFLRPLTSFPDTTCGSFLKADRWYCSIFFRSPNLSLRMSIACV